MLDLPRLQKANSSKAGTNKGTVIYQSINQLINKPDVQSINQTYCTINRSINNFKAGTNKGTISNQAINLIINQSINQLSKQLSRQKSINQSIIKKSFSKGKKHLCIFLIFYNNKLFVNYRHLDCGPWTKTFI